MLLFVVFFIYQLLEKRGMAVGLYMGLSTLGSFIFAIFGGIWAQTIGYYILYWAGAILGVLTLIFLLPVNIPRVKAAGVSTAGFGKAITNRAYIILEYYGFSAALESSHIKQQVRWF